MPEAKNIIRESVKNKISTSKLQLQDCNSKEIAGKILSLEEFQKAKAIMAFLSIKGEVITSHIIKHCFSQEKTVIVPKVIWECEIMEPVVLNGKDHQLESTKYNIMEPVNPISFPVEQIDLIIVPGLAFDENLNRLGRGGGYYDKFLSQKGCNAVKCGVAYEFQIFEKIPVMNHDQKMDIVITEERVIR